jgi:L-alanine-DL-glutamate epimerase-like enolase superfamily enzyme
MSSSPTSRRSLLRMVTGGAVAAACIGRTTAAEQSPPSVSLDELTQIASAPVLRKEFLTTPIQVVSIELLKRDKAYLLRTRSSDGLEVVTVPHQEKMAVAYPLLVKNVIPTFLKQDARRLEERQWDAWRAGSNYKLKGLLYGVCLMAVEQALLELMGQAAGRPVADFFGGAVRRDIPVYYASGNRGNAPEAEVEHLQRLVANSGVRALKFRLGGRKSRNADSRPGRTEALISLVRQTFGDQFTLYGDANSSYDAPEAIRIGRLMEEHGYGFYEEPCEFDDLWSTQQVTEALTIPIALGEQEFSLHRWRWCISARAADIMQPDLHYGGGFPRRREPRNGLSLVQQPQGALTAAG